MQPLEINQKFCIQLPHALAKAAGIKPGDLLMGTATPGKIVLMPRVDKKKWKVCCLNTFKILLDGIQITLPSKKLTELFAFLVCVGRQIPKKSAAQALWPESAPKQAMDSLYKLCRIVRNLEKDGLSLPFVIRNGTIGVDIGNLSLDLEEFQQLVNQGTIPDLERAVLLYQGPLLINMSYDWSTDYEGLYDIQYLQALESLSNFYGTAGNPRLSEYCIELANR